MRKGSILLAVFFVLVFTFIETAAQNTVFRQNDQVVIKSSISYAWLRESPTSDCACVVAVISSAGQILRIVDSSPVSDGVQNWWHVSTTTGTVKQGWIEEQSITLYKALSPATATLSLTSQPRQFASGAVQIREGIPFIWIRSLPSATSEIISTLNFFRPTTPSGCLKLVVGSRTVKWDGQQWWRFISQSPNASSGWVEENSLVDCKPTPSSAVTGQPTISPASSRVVTPSPTISTNAAYESFERGMMIWRQDTGEIYVLLSGVGFTTYSLDAYNSLVSPIDTPPAGRYTPINGFGKVWNVKPYFGSLIRNKIGWATTPEQGYTAQISVSIVASAAKPNTETTITLPNGRSVKMDTAFFSWSYK